MSKKLYGLISTLVELTGGIAIALISYFQPTNWAAINGAILIAIPAINDILLKFVDDTKLSKK